MPAKIDLRKSLSFGFEQTFTIEQWWTDEGFTATSDTPLKREKMLTMAQSISQELNGDYKESKDIWDHMQYETFDDKGNPSFVITMDPGSIEVKTPPVVFDDIYSMAQVMLKAANKAQIVPYRNWWYGVKGGTEGGCHVNMGGLSTKSNPLKKKPELVVKYAAYIHNRPFLHYPFMGIDIGPEGNAMRMDEKEKFEYALDAFDDYNDIYDEGGKLSAPKTYKHFEDTNIITEKASFPSLYKFKAPDYLIEDRAQEAMRTPEEFVLVAQMRLKILEYLLTQESTEQLIEFPENLHQEQLTSYYLWGSFQTWANEMDINPVPYQCFFDRQFPKLTMGDNPPQKFGLKEGRRPRVITDIQKRGDVVVSKTVDTHYKRFELYYYTESDELLHFQVKIKGLEHQSPMYKHLGILGFGDTGTAYYQYIDVKYDEEQPNMTIELIHNQTKEVIETATFNINDMQWK